jgi:hypothetical protein
VSLPTRICDNAQACESASWLALRAWTYGRIVSTSAAASSAGRRGAGPDTDSTTAKMLTLSGRSARPNDSDSLREIRRFLALYALPDGKSGKLPRSRGSHACLEEAVGRSQGYAEAGAVAERGDLEPQDALR